MTALAAVALAEPYYGYLGYPHQLQWPAVRAPGFSATCYGCRGKRSAEPEPFYGYYGHPFGLGYYGLRPYLAGPGVAGHPGGATSFTQRSPQGLSLGKRSAEEETEPEQAYGVHPSGGKSFVGNQVWGARGKRSAEPYYAPYYAHYPAGLGYHGYGATSYVGRTIWGLGK